MTRIAPSQENARTARTASILRDRNFLRLWTGETISILGTTISDFAIAIVAVLTLQATSAQIGLMRALGEAPAIVIGLFVGVWVDRVRRRRLLVTLDVLAALAVASIPIAHLLGVLSLGQLFVLAGVFGVLGTFWSPAWGAFLPTVVDRDRIVDANSKLTLAMSATGIVGPGLAGFLVQVLTAPIAMVVDAVSFLVSAVCVSGVRTRETAATSEDADTAPLGRQIRDGLRVAFLDPMQRAITTPLVLLEFVNALSFAVYAIFVLKVVRLPPAALGVVFAIASVGFLAGSAAAPWLERRMRAGRAAILGLGLVAASPFTMVLADAEHPLALNLFFLGLPGILGGFGGIVQWVMLSSLRQAITPEHVIGRVYASVGVLWGVMTILGALVGGFIGGEERLGPRGAILVAAIGYTIPFFWTLFGPIRDASTAGVDASRSTAAEPDRRPGEAEEAR
jgi:MFS family permease